MNEWLTEWMTDWLNEWLNDWLTDWMTEWMNERKNDWMNEWTNQKNPKRTCTYVWYLLGNLDWFTMHFVMPMHFSKQPKTASGVREWICTKRFDGFLQDHAIFEHRSHGTGANQCFSTLRVSKKQCTSVHAVGQKHPALFAGARIPWKLRRGWCFGKSDANFLVPEYCTEYWIHHP